MVDGNFRPMPEIAGVSKRDRKRQEILHCAAILFNTRGARGTTLTDITAELGLTKTSLYYYVKNKDDLAYQCYRESCRQFSLLIEAAAEKTDGSFLSTLYCSFLDVWAGVLERTRPAMTILSEVQSLKEPKQSEIKQEYVSLVLRIRDLLERDKAAGVYVDTNCFLSAHAFFSTLQWVPAWLTRQQLPSLPAIKKAAHAIIENGISSRPTALSENASQFVSDPENDPDDGLFKRGMSPDKKLEAFLQQATRQFNAKGYKGASIDVIAEELQVTKGAFYYHFKDKNQLLELCFKRGMSLGRAAIKFAEKYGHDGLDKFSFALGFMFSVQNSKAGPFVSPGLLTALEAAEKAAVLNEIAELTDRLGSYIDEGKSDKSVVSVDTFVAQSILTGAVLGGDTVNEWIEFSDMKEYTRQYLKALLIGSKPTPHNN
jgi:AcrR family transcriptional regulator